ncbi:MAG: inositol-3-phosphate synthase, partial [Myxococcota bacterium]
NSQPFLSSLPIVLSTMTSTTSTPPSTKVGLLIVGLGGNNGVTLLAGHLANAQKLAWETSAAGRVQAPNWNGCITQLPTKGGGVGFQDRYPLANFQNACVGGWDIRSTPLGDALYESRVLEYDLVRQVREEMNQLPIWKGIYEASFLGESQHATATHIQSPTNFKEAVELLRQDIRTFKETKQIDGHTTVMWSASVERPADVEYETAQELLKAIETSTEDDISPSMLYAVAAALEGCSFVNGGSQNTLSAAMSQLFETQTRSSLSSWQHVVTTPAYLLGTDFKAGQTKFKTAAVEYLRALGLEPRVIGSSNHLGNNDMLNLTSPKTVKAKLRVKKNIFEPWQEHNLDHQVKVMYTPMMLDEKRDVVEYTSLGFLNCPHTMLTYTRCMDSILCVPLMIDSAVWCDLFARCGVPTEAVARATAYLFKVPEGGAQGVDPGFQKQMQELEVALKQYCGDDATDIVAKGLAAGILTAEQAAALRKL